MNLVKGGKMKKIKILVASLLCFCVAVCTTIIVGCGGKDYTKINFNEVTHSIFYAPFYAANNLGYFEDEGLQINLTNGGGSDVSMTALISGAADMILAGPETVVYTSQEGITDQPMVFGQLTQTDGSFIVSKKGSDFKISDLLGETIIGGRAGGMPAMTLQYAIERVAGYQIGVGSDKVNLRTDVAFNAIASEFENSNANYCTLFEPNASNLVAAHPEYHIVASVADLVNQKIPYTCFIAKQSYLKNHSDIAEKFLKAVRRGYDFLKDCYENNHLEDAAQALKDSFTGMSIDDLKIAVAAYYRIDAFSHDMVMSRQSLDTLLAITQNAGMLNGNTDYNKIVNTEIASRLGL